MVKKKFNIFIADDHPIVIEGLRFLFKKDSEFELIGTANSIDSLFNQLSYIEVDLIILDLKMPGLDWNAMVKKLIVHYPDTKILVFTAYETIELKKTLKELGVHGFASKESDFHLLMGMIFKILDGEILFPTSKHQEENIPPTMQDSLSASDPFANTLTLSKKERDILVLLGRGYTSKKIAAQLYLSKHTVETHRMNIMHKLKLKNDEEMLRFAIDQGFV